MWYWISVLMFKICILLLIQFFILKKRLCPSSCNDIRHFWALNEFDFPRNALCNVALTLSKFSGKCWMTDPEDIEFRRIFYSHSLQFGEVPTNKMNVILLSIVLIFEWNLSFFILKDNDNNSILIIFLSTPFL